ncbi:MAG: hypothetical protein GDA43_20855 [Hormoscilla sp. SP5CHS1]|nr:hypothetical protein [Hormoscilla sp. SP12CHS1]MBC6455349.1 hypothetical protein [Hormoscilla sp. SP5CHS1]MBC6471962.1 hypothetical protein [Hormoscilla sp. GM102CHS1]MBO1352295.1 hypothetical protein [Hormoscilla sp. GUM202]
MHVVCQRVQLLEDRNRPQLQEADVNVLDYATGAIGAAASSAPEQKIIFSRLPI